jgi:hypothetical protein
MNADRNEAQVNTLKESIAKSREEMAALASRLDYVAVDSADESKWSAVQRHVAAAGSRGKRVAKGLADEIERHPLIGGMAAFGLGFGLASLLHKRAKGDTCKCK